MKRSGYALGILLVLLAAFVPRVSADGPAPGRAGRAEIRFIEGMIDHHQMAIDMANDCLAKASTEEVLALCQEIIDKQTAEITTLHDWLLAWYGIDYNPVPMMEMMGMMGMMPGGMMGNGMRPGGMMTGDMMGGDMMMFDPPMMMGMMSSLNFLEGQEYEAAFLEAMIDHHDDAVRMSERVLNHAEHQELRDMAQQIIDDQTAEIQAMEEMLTTLGVEA